MLDVEDRQRTGDPYQLCNMTANVVLLPQAEGKMEVVSGLARVLMINS